MKSFAVAEVGSTNTKSYFYHDGQITELPSKTIEFKKNRVGNKLAADDIDELCKLIKNISKKYGKTFVFGTSVFRDLEEVDRKVFISDFKKRTGADFTVVSPEQESDFTVRGVMLGNDFHGRLAVMIAGGASTEVSIVENKKVIEKHYNKFGVTTVAKKYPNLNNFKPDIAMKEIDAYCSSLVEPIKNKSDILVLAGGDFIYFYDNVSPERMQANNFYCDPLQPKFIDKKNAQAVDRMYVYRQRMEDYYKKFPETAAWWNGTRAMRFCVRAVAKRCDAKYIVPTKINMCLGIIMDLSKKNEGASLSDK